MSLDSCIGGKNKTNMEKIAKKQKTKKKNKKSEGGNKGKVDERGFICGGKARGGECGS
ncbi:hypothetical protein PP707_01185 [Acetobacter pasteurianus]|nr:hypothetical protein [Acetobacter pasteurianus]